MVKTNDKLRSLAFKVVLAGILPVVAGLAYLLLTPKIYRASTRLKVTD